MRGATGERTEAITSGDCQCTLDVAPITATAQSTAAQNRLTMAVNVRFINIKDPTKDFEQRFSFYYDYEGGAQLVGSQLDEALEAIYERITQDIFNASLANW